MFSKLFSILTENHRVFFTVLLLFVIFYTMYFDTKTTPLPYNENKAEGFSSSIKNDNVNIDDYKHINVEETKSGCRTILGFNGLFCDPSDDPLKIDLFMDTPGSINGSNKFGLSNSKGDLVINDEQFRLLRTRGGNIGSGGDAYIG